MTYKVKLARRSLLKLSQGAREREEIKQITVELRSLRNFVKLWIIE